VLNSKEEVKVFSIWHINGVDEKPLSLIMGENDYSNMIDHSKKEKRR
jgi:hypothetical protein